LKDESSTNTIQNTGKVIVWANSVREKTPLAGEILSPNETLLLVDTSLTFLAPLLTDIP
jgi:hypothetical protein